MSPVGAGNPLQVTALTIGTVGIGVAIFMALRCAIDIFNYMHHGEESKTLDLEKQRKAEAESNKTDTVYVTHQQHSTDCLNRKWRK